VLSGLAQTYNGSLRAATAATTPEGLTVSITYDGSSTAPANAGSYAVVATVNEANYQGTKTGTLVVGKATASVTPNAASKTYGGAEPTLSGTLSGFVATDAVTASYSRTAGESVGGSPYTISATLSPADVLGNYDIAYNSANFTIGTRAITVTAEAKSKTYGDSDPALTYTASPALVNGDAFTGGLHRASGENVGTYAIDEGNLSAGTNYALNFTGANLTIGAKAVR